MKEHYGSVASYIAALESENPRSTFNLFTNPSLLSNPPTFQRMFVCFEALKTGWLLGCRKILCVDFCFLKTFLGRQLMSAIGRDANDQMFPVAWAIVEGENNESYEWFFKNLKVCLGEQDGNGWTFVSDQHQSIITTISTEFPKAEHRHCARHIFANWHKTYKGDEMKLLFWNCVKAYTKADFDVALEALREVEPTAADAFLAYKPQLFCRAFISTQTKNDVIVNNIAETFNAYIINARAKHLIYMLEDIRAQLMKRLVSKKLAMEQSSHQVCPRIQKKLDEEKDKAAECEAWPSTTTVFQVEHGTESLKVDLKARTCTCRKWDLTGIPCFHAVAAIFYKREYAEAYVDDFYKREAYLLAYNMPINPCQSQKYWPKREFPLNPPPVKVGPGRPRKKRRRDPHEDPKRGGKLTKHGLQMNCSICKSNKHNKRKCPDKDKLQQPPPPKKPVGRPRREAAPSTSTTTSALHHEACPQPTRVGRGGRVITAGRGRATGKKGRADRGGKGRGRQAPVGFGVLMDDDGNAYTAAMHNIYGPMQQQDINLAQETTQSSINNL